MVEKEDKKMGVKKSVRGLEMARHYSKDCAGKVYDHFSWDKSKVNIEDESTGKTLYVQEGVEFPTQWSPLARKIVANKYFYGDPASPSGRESSVKQLVSRTSETLGKWAKRQNYFASPEDLEAFCEEFTFNVLAQKFSPNSPFWFNVGVDRYDDGKRGRKKEQREAYIVPNEKVIRIPKGKEREYPQTSACFIQSVKDTMEDIMRLAHNEALLFKYGSGTGTDLSTIRSSMEKLSGGGKPSGPLAYWKFYDIVAAIVKSGGKTRRAAKMNSLKISHPNIMNFIKSKRREEEKARILIDGGVDPIEAYETVAFQNTNISVRITDEFMQAVEKDEEWQTIPVHNLEMLADMPHWPAKEVLRTLAEATHFCGDPGMQFDDTINHWHTCPRSAPINASNPCSEYMFVDNSSCNLLSINLLPFDNPDTGFDVEGFKKTVRTATIVQDLNVDNSSFPTREITKNTHDFRPLGQGYANLGAMVMQRAIPYDSPEARAIAAAVTALQTGLVYQTSTELAENLGTFKEYEKNKKSMMKVMEMHRAALKNIDRTKLPTNLEAVLNEAEVVWENVIARGRKYGFRNAQATVLAPTGTIGFLMDCDTKGIEPEIGLVQTKLLSDGGRLRLVNGSVKPALRRLGYTPDQITQITEYICGNEDLTKAPHLKEGDRDLLKKQKESERTKFLKERGYTKEQIRDITYYVRGRETIEGAPHIKDEHLPIFDCSNKPAHAKRTISYMGHLEMMAAVQPFLSGAISKTVNLPNEATVEEVEKAYIAAWKMGLKAVALYRDGSKSYQPMNFSKDEKEDALREPVRRKLPTTRKAINHKFAIGGFGEDAHEGYLTLGFYPDGNLGEMFTIMSKEGSTVSGLLDTLATVTSLCLQYGVPIEKLAKKFRGMKYEPRGMVTEGRPDQKTTNSLSEYIFEAAARFAKEAREEIKKANNSENKEVKKSTTTDTPENKGDKDTQEEGESSLIKGERGGYCPVCGEQMFKKDHCVEKCAFCGHENQKGCGQ